MCCMGTNSNGAFGGEFDHINHKIVDHPCVIDVCNFIRNTGVHASFFNTTRNEKKLMIKAGQSA